MKGENCRGKTRVHYQIIVRLGCLLGSQTMTNYRRQQKTILARCILLSTPEPRSLIDAAIKLIIEFMSELCTAAKKISRVQQKSPRNLGRICLLSGRGIERNMLCGRVSIQSCMLIKS